MIGGFEERYSNPPILQSSNPPILQSSNLYFAAIRSVSEKKKFDSRAAFSSESDA